jgi:hypothetical protein
MCFEFDYFLSTDGGAAANGCADSLGFGSYCLQARTDQIRASAGNYSASSGDLYISWT